MGGSSKGLWTATKPPDTKVTEIFLKWCGQASSVVAMVWWMGVLYVLAVGSELFTIYKLIRIPPYDLKRSVKWAAAGLILPVAWVALSLALR
jgi:hypothetical protein